MKICPNCQIEYEDKFAFCHQCGSKLQEINEQNFCPYCGNKVETEGDFCPFCGNSFNENNSVTMSAPVVDNYYNPVNNSKSEPIAENGEDESTFKTVIKSIFYIIGLLILWFIIKVIGKGLGKMAVNNGYGLHMAVLGVIVLLLYLYFSFKKPKE